MRFMSLRSTGWYYVGMAHIPMVNLIWIACGWPIHWFFQAIYLFASLSMGITALFLSRDNPSKELTE